MNTYRTLALLLFLYNGVQLASFAQEANFYGARNESLARATVALNSSWSLFYNPSGMSYGKTEVLAGYQSKYTALGINDAAFGITFPIQNMELGFGASYFGDNLLNKSKVVGAFAHSIGKTSLGIKTTYDQLKIENIGTKGIFYIDIGGQIIINKEITIGMVISNINQAKFDTLKLSSPNTKLQVGVNYHPHEKLILLAQIEKDISNPANLKLALEYLVSQNVVVRTGVMPSPTSAYTGIGFIWQKISLDFVGTYQQTLGWSGGLSIGMPIHAKDEE